MKQLRFVCDKTPGPTGCTFIECEDETGASVCAGEWQLRPDGLVQLVVEMPGDEQQRVDLGTTARSSYDGLMERVKPVLDELDELLKVIGNTNGPRVVAMRAALAEFREPK